MNRRYRPTFSTILNNRNFSFFSIVFLFQFLAFFLVSANPVIPYQVLEPSATPSGHVATADELVYYTNLRRTQYGLPALSVNSILMSTAQQTAEIMAGSQESWHIGGVSSRIQQAGYGGGVTVWATENIANGTGTSAEELVYVIWNDNTHNIPVMNPIYCDIGAGVAVDAEGTSYFVIHAAYTEKRYCGEYIAPDGTTLETIYANEAGSIDLSETQEAEEISQFMQPVSRVTPNSDGQIIHEVNYGQTLWSIAITYGTKIKDIQILNGMTEDDQTVYPGQILLIPTSLTPYPTEEMTETPHPKQTMQLIITPSIQSSQSSNKATKTATQVMVERQDQNKSSFSTIIFWVAVGGLLLILFGVLSRFLPSEET